MSSRHNKPRSMMHVAEAKPSRSQPGQKGDRPTRPIRGVSQPEATGGCVNQNVGQRWPIREQHISRQAAQDYYACTSYYIRVTYSTSHLPGFLGDAFHEGRHVGGDRGEGVEALRLEAAQLRLERRMLLRRTNVSSNHIKHSA